MEAKIDHPRLPDRVPRVPPSISPTGHDMHALKGNGPPRVSRSPRTPRSGSESPTYQDVRPDRPAPPGYGRYDGRYPPHPVPAGTAPPTDSDASEHSRADRAHRQEAARAAGRPELRPSGIRITVPAAETGGGPVRPPGVRRVVVDPPAPAWPKTDAEIPVPRGTIGRSRPPPAAPAPRATPYGEPAASAGTPTGAPTGDPTPTDAPARAYPSEPEAAQARAELYPALERYYAKMNPGRADGQELYGAEEVLADLRRRVPQRQAARMRLPPATAILSLVLIAVLFPRPVGTLALPAPVPHQVRWRGGGVRPAYARPKWLRG
eukprot:gene8022-13137_t